MSNVEDLRQMWKRLETLNLGLHIMNMEWTYGNETLVVHYDLHANFVHSWRLDGEWFGDLPSWIWKRLDLREQGDLDIAQQLIKRQIELWNHHARQP